MIAVALVPELKVGAAAIVDGPAATTSDLIICFGSVEVRVRAAGIASATCFACMSAKQLMWRYTTHHFPTGNRALPKDVTDILACLVDIQFVLVYSCE